MVAALRHAAFTQETIRSHSRQVDLGDSSGLGGNPSLRFLLRLSHRSAQSEAHRQRPLRLKTCFEGEFGARITS